MRRDVDLMRRIVLAVERGEDELSDGTGYGIAVVSEHARMCVDAGLVALDADRARLTPAGHDLAALARDDEGWERVRARLTAAGFGSAPLDVWTDQLRADASGLAHVRAIEEEHALLREFALWALRGGPFEGADLYGGDVEEEALRLGILVPRIASEACGEACSCAETGEFPLTCNRLADWMEHPLRRVGEEG